MTPPRIPLRHIRVTLPDGTVQAIERIGLSVAAAEYPQALRIELVGHVGLPRLPCPDCPHRGSFW